MTKQVKKLDNHKKVNSEKTIIMRLKKIEGTFKKEKKLDIQQSIIHAKMEIDVCYKNQELPLKFYVKRYKKVVASNKLFNIAEALLTSVLATFMYIGIEEIAMLISKTDNSNTFTGIITIIKTIFASKMVILMKILFSIAIVAGVIIIILAFSVLLVSAMIYISRRNFNDYKEFVQSYEIDKLKEIIADKTSVSIVI